MLDTSHWPWAGILKYLALLNSVEEGSDEKECILLAAGPSIGGGGGWMRASCGGARCGADASASSGFCGCSSSGCCEPARGAENPGWSKWRACSGANF
jgi:hypothetical protein